MYTVVFLAGIYTYKIRVEAESRGAAVAAARAILTEDYPSVGPGARLIRVS